MMKIKFPSKKQLISLSKITVITLLIIAIGVLIPAVMLRIKTSSDKALNGSVNVNELNVLANNDNQDMNSLLRASNGFWSGAYNEADAIRYISKSNDFMEIGIESRRRSEGYEPRREGVAEYADIIENIFEGQISESYACVNLTSLENNLEAIKIYDDSSVIIVDSTTGLPIYSNIVLLTPSSAAANKVSMDEFCQQIISIYTEYSGVVFEEVDYDYNYSYSLDGYDSAYTRQIVSADGSLSINFAIESGWYWSEPEFEGDDWHPTDDYIWTIDIDVIALG